MYRFYAELTNGNLIEVFGLTKRQAVIRYNKACKEIGHKVDRCGWELQESNTMS